MHFFTVGLLRTFNVLTWVVKSALFATFTQSWTHFIFYSFIFSVNIHLYRAQKPTKQICTVGPWSSVPLR